MAGGRLNGDDEGAEETQDGWEADRLLDMVSHDLINQQQAALGFLELLEGSLGLTEGERVLVSRTVEALEHTSRMLLQMRAAMVERERGGYRPARVPLDRALETAGRMVQVVFARDQLTVETRGLEGSHPVVADGMLTDMLTQLLLLLGEPVPAGRRCTLTASVEPAGDMTAVRFSSEGFALDPMVTEALIGGRQPQRRTRDAAALSLVRHLLTQYGATARMEPAPSGGVGAHLVIELPSGTGSDAEDNDSR